MRISLDMDSVIADILPVTCQIIEEWTGFRTNKLMIDNWDFLPKFGLDNKIELKDLFRETWNRWNQIHPTEEHIGGKVGELMLLGQVDVVSSSETHSAEERKKWLAKYHVPYSNFIQIGFGNNKMDLSYDIWIDDAPYQAEIALKTGKSLLLYTQPFNIKIANSDKVKRIFSLADARKIIKEARI